MNGGEGGWVGDLEGGREEKSTPLSVITGTSGCPRGCMKVRRHPNDAQHTDPAESLFLFAQDSV